ncbi:GHMP kinase, partial [Mesorhizobium sp. M7A.F.Ca.CA.004.01.1.1]
SSWGPTGFAFAPSHDAALKFVDAVRKTTIEDGLEIKIVKGRNSGAKISSTRLNLVGS